MARVFVLVHSPSVGPSTWRPVADRLAAAGFATRVPSLTHVAYGGAPFWPRIVAAVRAAVADVPVERPVVLVAHSNAGLLLPVIRAGLTRQVAASVFVDATLPARAGSTPVAPPDLVDALRAIATDGLLPRWTDWWDEADVAPLFPDPVTRFIVTAEQPALPLSYFEQAVPVPAGWDDHPRVYLRFSAAYEPEVREAAARGWPVAYLPGGHLHQLVDPDAVARYLLAAAT
ncbi:MAG TPA: alpha/beta fold hydrolase [Actinocatenispora sp.]